MSAREQNKLLEALKRYASSMSPQDKEEYRKMVQRQKDDEDFDSVTMKKLQEIHKRYVSYKSKEDLDNLFKK